ncbi:uncharacterized protein VTP21DRAFT_5811 [Calcarisporiella thermophila]|uniref:uncharacterized protein n=1 Tax=Calcarisporiella thermophila TaxID=911321 RepID=UPI0037431EB6
MQEHFRSIGQALIPVLIPLITRCHDKGIPCFWTQHGHRNFKNDGGSLGRWWGEEDSIVYGTKAWQLMPELARYREKADATIDSKMRYDAFMGTELGALLKSHGVKTLIIAGVMTNLCCETTARSAFNLDYNVVFLSDGCATASKEMHEATLLNLEFGFAKIVKTEDAIAMISEGVLV